MAGSTSKTISRKKLYDLVWSKPMIHGAAEFGITGNGLAKACRKLDVPYPPRGYWAKHAVGKAPPATGLPAPQPEVPESVTISASGRLDDEEKAEIVQARADFEEARNRHSAISVPERLAKPHPVIASWLAEKKERQERARLERDPRRRSLWHEAAFTTIERRRHRILHALFHVLEKEGGVIAESEQKVLRYEREGVSLEFQLREKFRQVRRPLTEYEKRWRSASEKDWKLDLEATGLLLFELRTYRLAGLRKSWLESETKPMETLLPDIVATFAAAIPLLVEDKRQRDEQEQRWRDEAELRRKEEQRQRLDAARWRRFLELAGQMREADLARQFLARIRAGEPDLQAEAGTDTVGDWLAWAEARIAASDPLERGASGIFAEVAEVNQWTYRD